MTMTKQYKRRNIFIKKELQGKLIFGYFLFVTGGCLFFIILLGYFSADTLTISYTNSDLQLGRTPFMLLKSILTAHWIFIVLGAIFITIAAMLITHRIAGPLFRFEKTLAKMLNRDLSDVIHLRYRDEGKELARQINTFNRDLSETIKKLTIHTEAIKTLLKQADTESSTLPEDHKKNMKAILWNIEENNKKIQSICSSYTLRDE
ncbi:methyl-accepting chemotaxis protein [Desulfomarina sp.]